MTKDPAQRFPSPAEIADALASFVDASRKTSGLETVHDSDSIRHRSWWPPTTVQSVGFAAFACVLAGIIYVTTDNGTLKVEAADESVEVIIRSTSNSGQAKQLTSEMQIVDTVTGTSAKRLPSGEYVLSLKGGRNDYEIDKDHFVLRRGDKVIVRVTPARRLRDTVTTHRLGQVGEVQGAPASNEQFISTVDWSTGDLAIRETETGKMRRLTKKGTWVDSSFAGSSVVSPDNKRVAYTWFTNEGEFFELRIIDIDGHEPEVVYSNQEATTMQVHQWSRDGRFLLVLMGK